MDFKRHALTLAFTLAALLGCGASEIETAHAQQAEAPHRQRGPVASPVIKLPRGEGATPEQPSSSADAKSEGVKGVEAGPRKWEYCAITGVNWHQKGLTASSASPSAVIRYFPSTYEEVEGGNEDDALANAFARLGEEGWELGGVKVEFNLTDGNGKSSTVYYFKRPRRAE
jgi:hypothetical protein